LNIGTMSNGYVILIFNILLDKIATIYTDGTGQLPYQVSDVAFSISPVTYHQVTPNATKSGDLWSCSLSHHLFCLVAKLTEHS